MRWDITKVSKINLKSISKMNVWRMNATEWSIFSELFLQQSSSQWFLASRVGKVVPSSSYLKESLRITVVSAETVFLEECFLCPNGESGSRDEEREPPLTLPGTAISPKSCSLLIECLCASGADYTGVSNV